MANNINPETGAAYGVISTDSLDPDLVQELFCGPNAVDTTYQAAYEDAKAEAHRKYDDILAAARQCAMDAGLCGDDFDISVAEYFEGMNFDADEIVFVEQELESFSDQYESYEPDIEGVYEGIKYLIRWLGGAPLLWSVDGPRCTPNAWCSPCVPGAADLDQGFELEPDGCAHGVPLEGLAEASVQGELL